MVCNNSASQVYVKNKEKPNLINKFIKVHIIDVKDYDLIGEIV